MNKMIKLSLYSLIFTGSLPLLGGGTVSLPSKGGEAKITEEQFIQCKLVFPETSDLRKFINAFEEWPQEDKEKIVINGLSFTVERTVYDELYYGGNLGVWIDCRTKYPIHRKAFMGALQYLQSKS